MAHGAVELERGVGVDDGQQRGFGRQLRVGDAAADDLGDLQPVSGALRAERVVVEGHIREQGEVAHGLQMPGAAVDVGRLDRVAGDERQAMQALDQPGEVAEVLAVALPPPAVGVAGVGGRGDGDEVNIAFAQGYGPRRVAGVELEGRGRGLDALFDHGRVEADQIAVGADLGAGRAQDGLGVFAEELHADLAEDLQRGVVDGLDLIGGQGFDRGDRVAHRAPGQLLDRRGGGGRSALRTPATRAAAPGSRLIFHHGPVPLFKPLVIGS